MISDRCPVLSVLSVCDVGVLWPNCWMALGMEVGLSPGHIVQDGNPAPSLQKRGHSPQFSAHV